MKKKSVITIISVSLNLVLLSALAYFNKINNHAEGCPAPSFVVQHLGEIDHVPADRHEIALASTVK